MIEDGNSKDITREQVATIHTADLNGKPRICIFSAFNEAYKPLADIARPNWREYAERHNYAVRFYPQGYHLDASHSESFGDKNRFNWYYDIKGHAEIVVHLDIDSLFVNMDVAIEDFLSPPTMMGHPTPWLRARFLWTYAEGGPMSGLWIARTDEVTEKHLRYAYEYAASENNVRHGSIEPNGISDQDAMTRLMHVPPFSDTFGNCVPAERVGFCYPDSPQQNPWIVTCRGGSLTDKLSIMQGQPLPFDWKSIPEVIQVRSPAQEAFDAGQINSEQLARAEYEASQRPDNGHSVPAYNPRFAFDPNWAGPPELKPRVYRTQSEKDTWYAIAVENEYRLVELRPDDTVIDIGMHIGSFSFLAYMKGSRSIYSYEIDPWHVEGAGINIADMREGIAMHHCAVVRGDEKRAAEYHYDGAWHGFGLHGPVVESKSLDQIINEVCTPEESVRFLKIDIEGGEYPTLYTCRQMDRIDEIAGEWHTMLPGPPELADLPYETNENGLRRFLEVCGYDVEIVRNTATNGGFFAKRRVALHRGNRYANAKFGTVVKLS